MRQRLALLTTAIVVGAAGYWLRFPAPIGPEWRDRFGGVFYVVFWIIVVAIFIPATRSWRLVLSVFLVTCALEFAQLWHPAWLEAARGTFVGRVVLGTTFDWSDFPPYVFGALLGGALLHGIKSISKAKVGDDAL